MAHSPDRPDREFSASQTYEDMAENLFAAPPLGLDKLFDDPIVRRRIGEIICLVIESATEASSSRATENFIQTPDNPLFRLNLTPMVAGWNFALSGARNAVRPNLEPLTRNCRNVP